MKYGYFYYSYGVYGTEASPNLYATSASTSATTSLLRRVQLAVGSAIAQSIMTANLINIWDTTELNPATWTTVALTPSVWTDKILAPASWTNASVAATAWADQTVPDADWQDTRT
jgi:hypothetical protein